MFSASSLFMCRNSTLPPARAALIMTLTAGLSMAERPRGRGRAGGGKERARRGGRGAEFNIAGMDDPSFAAAARIRVVLVGTQHPGNIGSAARALKTMGLSRLSLVAPERYPHADASALAAGADDVLAGASLHGTLAEAVADCRLVLGCTARSRRIALPEQGPREAAATLLAEASAGAEVALVFGRERTGLENDELQLCHGAVHIAANPGYSSLNLAAAVQVLAYELRMAWLAGVEPALALDDPGHEHERDQPATHAQMEGLFGQLAETLDAIDF